MFQFLRRRSARSRSRVPAGRRIYAIGDIHGRADLLDQIHAAISADIRKSGGNACVVYLGDYIDRGSDSAGVIERFLTQPLDGAERIFLLGNHELTLLQFLEDPQIGVFWLRHGGLETVLSYGVSLDRVPDQKKQLEALRLELASKLPESHLEFFRSLGHWHSEGDYLFVHAGIRPSVPLSQQTLDDFLWIREPFLGSTRDHGYVVVHGHSPVDQPEAHFNRINIDTGAYLSGVLTCLILEEDERRLIRTL